MKILLNGVFRYAKREEYTTFSISQFMGDLQLSDKAFVRQKKKSAEEQVFNETETQILIRHLWENPIIENLGLILMFQTGLRVGELSTIAREDITPDYIYIHSTETTYKDRVTGERVVRKKESAKTENGDREVLLPKQALITLKAIQHLNPFGEFLFMKNGERIKTGRFNYRLGKACEETEILRRSTHKVRKTYASALFDKQISETLIMSQMGHANIETTKTYYGKQVFMVRKDPAPE